MPRFDASSIFTQEAERLRAIVRGNKDVVGRAAGTLARRLPVQARRDMQAEYNIKASVLNPYISVRKDGNTVTLIGRGRGTGKIEFAGQWNRKNEGATAKVFRDQPRFTYDGTFIAVGKSGNRHIFERVNRKGGSRRQTIQALYGPSVAGMLRKGQREERLAQFAQSIMATEVKRLLKL